jgi:hypothetical protein
MQNKTSTSVQIAERSPVSNAAVGMGGSGYDVGTDGQETP